MYRALNADRLVDTLVVLRSRIGERFPGSGLEAIGGELLEVARESRQRATRLERPNWLLRCALIVLAIGLAAVLAAAARRVKIEFKETGIVDILQGIESGVNELVLLVLATAFLLSVEGRLKRRVALRALHELRSIAHVVDMHQLTKDPETLLLPGRDLDAPPRRPLDRFQMIRYLDYCSELLSLTSKLAALHVQQLRDPVVLDAVNDVETLADDLSHKIGQKLIVLQLGHVSPPADDRGPSTCPNS